MPELDRDTARAWIERWDRQQEDSLPDREDRFTALIDAVEEGTAKKDPLRHRHLGAGRLFVKHFGGEVAVALAEQQPAERHALARRPQADLAQHRLHVMPRATRKLRAVGRLRRRGGRYIREYHGARLAHRYAQTASPGGPARNRFICNIYALAP